MGIGDLSERGIEHGDVIGDVVGGGVAAPRSRTEAAQRGTRP
jgi:nitrogenase subunit NifH